MDFDEDSSNTREASCTPPLPTTDLTPNEIMKFGPGGEDLPTPERLVPTETVPEEPTLEETAATTTEEVPKQPETTEDEQQQGVVPSEADKNGEQNSNDKDGASSPKGAKSAVGETGEKTPFKKPDTVADEGKRSESE